MPIVYRSTLGRPLTYNEMDGNFADLAARTDQAWMMDGLEPTLREGVGNPAELAMFIGNNQRFLLRLFRDGADAADTFPDNAYLVGIDFYYQVDQFGTPSYTPPYT